MKKLKYANKNQIEAVKKALNSCKNEPKTDTEIQYIVVGEEFNEPSVIIVNKGELGIDFINKDGKVSWLNSSGEHMLLQFLIDKQYDKHIVRNSKELSSGRDDDI